MAAVRSHITIQRAVIGSEIKTLSTTADGEGLREREKEREQVAGKMTNQYNLSVCVCAIPLIVVPVWLACTAKVNTEMEAALTAPRLQLKDIYIFIYYL